MGEAKESSDNRLLSQSCSNAGASCCKDGYIFLPRAEYKAILKHLEGRRIELGEFMSRITDHGDFLLYDQQTRCQFLQTDDRCQLHSLGIKPTECFWWPAHVYLTDDGCLEIRVAACCSGCELVNAESAHIQKVTEQAGVIGLSILKKFREIHSYGKNYRVIKRL